MNIYAKEQKEMKKIMRSFLKTGYGKNMFILSYSMFFIFLCQGLIFLFLHEEKLLFYIPAFLSLISFVAGSINYYKELRIYAKDRKQD